ncbi:hypothetical protein PDIDSM_1853 [Penicillium digitatum]|nr:hypothetical protein PDIDSM_1853 [Penicillium digitatum]
MISCYQLFVTLWRITLGLTFLFALVLGGGMAFFPESPRYEFRHGKAESAQSTLAKLYGIPENHVRIIEEMREIREQFEAESDDQKWNEFLTAPRMLYRIALGMGTTIFQGAGISDSFVTQCILGAVNFGTTFGGLYVVENFGRRKSLMFGAVWMFAMFMIFASIGHFVLDVETPSNTPMPAKYRAKGMALATATNWLWNFLLSFFTTFITKDIDFAYGYVFAGCSLEEQRLQIPERHQDWIADENPYGRKSQGTPSTEIA